MGLSIFFQYKNKKSMLISLESIFKITTAPTDPNLAELIRRTSIEILTPIQLMRTKEDDDIDNVMKKIRAVKEVIE